MTGKPAFIAELTSEASATSQIWKLTGKLMGGTSCYEFLETVRENVAQGQVNAVLDMSAVPWANSTGLGVLASIYTSAKNAGGNMLLVGVGNRVESTLKVINLWYALQAFASVEEAEAHLDNA